MALKSSTSCAIYQAFHWCPDYEAAAAEFARVLKPDGILALIWNLEDRDHARWVAQLRDRIESHEEGTPQFRLGLWRAMFEASNYNKHFTPPDEQQWPYSLPATAELVVNRAFTKSYIAVLPEEQKRSVEQDVRNIVERGEDRIWIDQEKGVFEYPYKTYVVISRKK
jgi:SAM-dependent methyltransferase